MIFSIFLGINSIKINLKNSAKINFIKIINLIYLQNHLKISSSFSLILTNFPYFPKKFEIIRNFINGNWRKIDRCNKKKGGNERKLEGQRRQRVNYEPR